VRSPVPAPALLLVAAALASDAVPGLYDVFTIHAVEWVAVVALVVILFNGGMDLGWARARASAAPTLSLGLVGTFLTAGLATVFAHVALGMDWTVAGLVGAAVAPTDPAVTFSVLGSRPLKGRTKTILESEAGVNDPAGIAVMLGLIELVTHDDATAWVIARVFLLQMVVGAAFGLIAARLLAHRLRHPVVALAVAGALYAVTALAEGSGFLAVFLLGMWLGDAHPPSHRAERFHTSLAAVAEVVVFVALGLTIHLDALSTRDWLEGVAIAVVVGFAIRPLVVAVTLARADLARPDKAFIAWSGLKGAVPILLAAFTLIHHVDDGQRIYGLVFVVVLFSIVVQGTLVPTVARRLRVYT
jgi:cell volume regulation protein A